MEETVQFMIGAEASCSDGACGQVLRVIVDPVAEAVTHLVVVPKHQRDPGRLVPLDLVDATAGEIRLRCTRAEFEKLDLAEETDFIAGTGTHEGYGPGQVGYWPYYGLGSNMGIGGLGMAGIGGMGMDRGGNVSDTVTYDTVPLGEVEVRRGEHVHATDGQIGRVQGLVIDLASRHVTHVLLQDGHLWDRKEVAIPMSAVASTSDGIQLKITRQEVQDLPPVDISHPGAPQTAREVPADQ
jgi:sporulation protein YlmC with PRC-barrel domain